MKKKLSIILFIALSLCFASGCTLHFKAEKMEIETRPPEARIGQNKTGEQLYQLASIDVFKNAQ